MKKIFVAMAAGVCSLAMFAAQAQAGLVQVVIDNFSKTGNPVVTVDSGPVQVDRTRTGGLTLGASVGATAGQTLTLAYVSSGGSFNDLFDLYKAGSGPLGTINPTTTNAAMYGFQVDIVNDGITGGTISDGTTTFALTTDTTQSFVFKGYEAPTGAFSVTFDNLVGTGSFSMTSVSAVPEPSALLLVGSVLGLGYAKRRRR